MRRNYSKDVSMQCSTCAGAEFKFDDANSLAQCVRCDRIFTREELIRENGARIESEMEFMKAQIASDIYSRIKNKFGKIR